jgi:hypothetical protein
MEPTDPATYASELFARAEPWKSYLGKSVLGIWRRRS